VRNQGKRFLSFLFGLVIFLAAGLVLRPDVGALVISSFQGSARFVWVPLYAIVLLAVAGVSHCPNERRATLLLGFAAALQIFDTTPLWKTLQYQETIQRENAPDQDKIDAAMARAKSVILLPTYLCAYAQPIDLADRDRLVAHIVDLQVFASQAALPINSVRNSRMTATNLSVLQKTCDAEREAAIAGASQPGVLTVVVAGAPAEANAAKAIAFIPGCKQISGDLVCLRPPTP
jgi:hypothetical protein